MYHCMATLCFAAGRSLLVYNPLWLCPSCWRSLAAAGRLFPFLRRGASSPRYRSFHAPPPPPSVTVEIGGRWGWGRGWRDGEKESVEDGESSCVPCCNMLAAEFCGQHRVSSSVVEPHWSIFTWFDILPCSPITFSTGRYANLADGAVLVQVRVMCLDCDSWLTSIPYPTVANTRAIHAYIHQLHNTHTHMHMHTHVRKYTTYRVQTPLYWWQQSAIRAQMKTHMGFLYWYEKPHLHSPFQPSPSLGYANFFPPLATGGLQREGGSCWSNTTKLSPKRAEGLW